MKFIKILLLAFLTITFFACQNQNSHSGNQSTVDVNADNRPKEELTFLNRVLAESAYQGNADNAVQKDNHAKAFNKYALDSLKNIKNWELIITEINDNPYSSTSVFQKLNGPGDGVEVYNLKLVAPIKIDHSVDTIAINNRVDFTITISKKPKDAAEKKLLAIINTLAKDDVVTVSGSLTHLNDKGEIDFSPFYDKYYNWDVDLLPTDIRKKAK